MTDEHKEYLNKIRDTGISNMYFAIDHLINKFRITHEEAKFILEEWFESIKKENTPQGYSALHPISPKE